MMSPVFGETALSGFPTYAVPPAGCRTAALNGSAVAVSRTGLNIVTNVSTAGPSIGRMGSSVGGARGVGGYMKQNTGASLGNALASVRCCLGRHCYLFISYFDFDCGISCQEFSQ